MISPVRRSGGFVSKTEKGETQNAGRADRSAPLLESLYYSGREMDFIVEHGRRLLVFEEKHTINPTAFDIKNQLEFLDAYPEMVRGGAGPCRQPAQEAPHQGRCHPLVVAGCRLKPNRPAEGGFSGQSIGRQSTLQTKVRDSQN